MILWLTPEKHLYTSCAAGETIDPIDSAIRENIIVGTGIGKVPFYVLTDLGPVQVRQLALKVHFLDIFGIKSIATKKI